MSQPLDLIPLPTMPYDERPVALPLDIEECRTAIWRCRGNITKAAVLLKVSPDRLRRFVRKSPRLSAEMEEAQEQLLDIAEDNLAEALEDADTVRKDIATKFVLKELGGRRGYGTGNKSIVLKPGNERGSLKIVWGDDTDISQPVPEDNIRTINHDD